jgi:hypothetical protein
MSQAASELGRLNRPMQSRKRLISSLNALNLNDEPGATGGRPLDPPQDRRTARAAAEGKPETGLDH